MVQVKGAAADFEALLMLTVVLIAGSATLLAVFPQVRVNRRLTVLSSEYDAMKFWEGEDFAEVGGFISEDRQQFSFSNLQGVAGGVVTYTDVVRVNNTDSAGHMVKVRLESWDATEAALLNYVNLTMLDFHGVQQGNTVHLVPGGAGQTADSGFVFIAPVAWFRFKWDIYWQADATVIDAVNVALALVVGDHDIAVTGVEPYRTIVGSGSSTRIAVQVANRGVFNETFEVAMYSGADLIEERPITLASQTNTTIYFTWNTTGVPNGEHEIKVVASAVPDESDLLNNVFGDGTIDVSIVGDLNNDGKVDIFDLVAAAAIYGSDEGDFKWNANADLDEDRRITLLDLVELCLNYGRSRHQ